MNITQRIKLYANLLDQVADLHDSDVTLDWFTEKSRSGYQLLLTESVAYLLEGGTFHHDRYALVTAQLGSLRNQSAELEKKFLDNTDPVHHSLFRAVLAMYINHQLTEAMEMIKPENLLSMLK